MAPTPTMQPCPGMSRGTECSVPMVPGLCQADRGALEVRDGELAATGLANQVLVRRPELAEVHLVGALDVRHQELPRAVLRLQVDRQAEVDVVRRGEDWLAVFLGVRGVHLRVRLECLDDGVADQVGEGDLPAPAALQVVVDDDAVVDEQLGRHRSHRGGGGHREAGRHVLGGAGGGTAQPAEVGVEGGGATGGWLGVLGVLAGRAGSGRRGPGALGALEVLGAAAGAAGTAGAAGATGALALAEGDAAFSVSAGTPSGMAGCDPVPFPRWAGSRRRSSTTPGRPSQGQRGNAGIARRRATRWRRSWRQVAGRQRRPASRGLLRAR